MIQAIIFDTHGVVLSGERFSTIVENKHDHVLKRGLELLKKELHTYLTGHEHIGEAIAKYFDRTQWEKPNEEMMKYYIATEQYVDKKLITFIMGLRHMGLHCYLVTSQEQYKKEYILDKMGLGLIFEHIFSTQEMKVKKVEPAFFQKIMEQLPNLVADEILYWDDLVDDVEKAKAFGWKAEVYKGFDDFRKKMKTYVEV